MNDSQRQFLDRAKAEADRAQHPFAAMTACEAALESGWGNSELARDANNLFGMKQHAHAVFGTMNLPTREFLDSAWHAVTANWVKYPDWRSCFADRLATLERLSNAFPHYKAALNAQDPRSYVIQVSESWSTDPGWECTCCSMFQSEAAMQQHAKDYLNDPEHGSIQRIEGLGRALKILAFYEDYAATPAKE